METKGKANGDRDRNWHKLFLFVILRSNPRPHTYEATVLPLNYNPSPGINTHMDMIYTNT
jgi:hypothetical protein